MSKVNKWLLAFCYNTTSIPDWDKLILTMTKAKGMFADAINGKLYSVNPAAINEDSYRVFQENKRYVTVIQTDNGKYVFAIPVGAAMVGSIVFENDDGTSTVRKGDRIEAGALHGKMRFGGSTVVYLFEEGTIEFDEELETRCTENWTEKIPCTSALCDYSVIWEDERFDDQTIHFGPNTSPCRKCNDQGYVEGKTWPMMESYYQAGERLGKTTIQVKAARRV